MSIIAGTKRSDPPEPAAPLANNPATPVADAASVAAEDADPAEGQGDDWVPEPSHAGGKGPRIPLRGTASGEADDGDESRSPKADGDGGSGRLARRKQPGQQLSGDHHPLTP